MKPRKRVPGLARGNTDLPGLVVPMAQALEADVSARRRARARRGQALASASPKASIGRLLRRSRNAAR